MSGRSKILLVDSCYEADSLSRYEFVHPVKMALEQAGFPCRICHISILDGEILEGCDRVVLCGTALKDNEYLNHLERYSWLKEADRPVLGICAGMQIIAAIFGGKIMSRHKPAIGLEKIEVAEESDLLGPSRDIEVYHLHTLDPTLPDGFHRLAGTELVPEAFSHCDEPIWGLLFHPEVRNRWILENYANL